MLRALHHHTQHTSTSNQIDSTFLSLHPCTQANPPRLSMSAPSWCSSHWSYDYFMHCYAFCWVPSPYQMGLTAKWCGECFILRQKSKKDSCLCSLYDRLHFNVWTMSLLCLEQFMHCDIVFLHGQWSKMVSRLWSDSFPGVARIVRGKIYRCDICDKLYGNKIINKISPILNKLTICHSWCSYTK